MLINDNLLNNIINESINSILDEKNIIIDYIKSFGNKGKLPSFNDSIKDIYKKYFLEAFNWAEQNSDELKYNGKVWAEREIYVNTIGKWLFNKRGLVYVERSIDIDISDIDNLKYKSVGECWSWKKNNSRSYCANFSLNNNNIRSIILCGYVHPNSIDWLETIYLNLYNMKNETEIRMNDNSLVEVSYIKINGVKYSLKGSYLINASSDKYNKNNWL